MPWHYGMLDCATCSSSIYSTHLGEGAETLGRGAVTTADTRSDTHDVRVNGTGNA
jgi:hypothetical protein